MKDFFKLKGISKTLLMQAALVLFGMAILSIGAVGLYRYKAQENLKATTYAQVQIIRSAIVQPFWNVDYKSMRQIVESILSESSTSIATIRILELDSPNEQHKVLLDLNGPKWNNHDFETLKQNSEFIFWESDVVYKDNPLGEVQVIFNISEPLKEIASVSFFLAVGLIFFTAFCVSLFLTLHLRRLSNELQKQVDERTRELDGQRMAMVNSSRLASLGEMSAGIAHEINNPLAVIDGAVRLITRTIATNGDVQKMEMYLAKISKMITRITKIINGLRAFSRDGSQEPMTEFYVERFFADISDLCHSNLSHKKVDLQFILENRDTVMTAREVQLSQVMINMINNSADAIEHLTEKWIKVECYSKNEDLVISITDSGPGIALEIQRKMLQPFFTTKELGKGTGLGLSISVGIVESHGGKLAYCQNHKNTRFEITLKSYHQSQVRSAA